MFKLSPATIPGLYEIHPRILSDSRGHFVKTLHREQFAELGLRSDFVEEYFSLSGPGVLRGLHFQVPPADHVKLVYCIQGQVWDVILDLRKGSPTYLQHAVFELSAEQANMVYIPAGCAHGFCTTTGDAVLVYKVTSVYSPQHDQGILWSSAGIPWPVANPQISERDSLFPPLAEFSSPFPYSP